MFDWMTWSVWLIGLVILVIWIVVPFKEFAQMRKRMRARAEEPRNEKQGEVIK